MPQAGRIKLGHQTTSWVEHDVMALADNGIKQCIAVCREWRRAWHGVVCGAQD